MNKGTVHGGTIEFSMITSDMNAAEQEKRKVHIWLYMIQDGMIPTSFKLPSKKGMRVEFDQAKSENDFAASFEKLQEHIEFVNKAYDLDIELKKKEEETDERDTDDDTRVD